MAERHPGSGARANLTGAGEWSSRLYEADNLAVMAALRAEFAGRFTLLYADPPFATGGEFQGRAWIGGKVGGGRRSAPRQIVAPQAYLDRWDGGITGYLEAMYPRLLLMRDLLAEDGSLYLHVDPRAAHYLKVLLDEVFGPDNFQREIIWRIGWVSGFKTRARNWVRNHDTILFYSKTSRFKFRRQFAARPEGYCRRGDEARRVTPGVPLEDVWTDLPSIQIMSYSAEKSGYPTQKNENLLNRIIQAATDPGDLVGDFYCGSGTTLVTAERLGRGWVGADSGRLAIHTARKRLRDVGERGPFELIRPAVGDQACPGAEPERNGGLPAGWPSVELERPPEGLLLRLAGSSEQLDVIDYWSVGNRLPGGGREIAWESHRTRRRPDLATCTPSLPDAAGRGLEVQLVDVGGVERFFTIPT